MELQEAFDKAIKTNETAKEKIEELQKIAKTIDIWAKEYDYELIPIIKLLNNKIDETLKILRN